MKKDDSSLLPASLVAVKKHAVRALDDAGAYGIFPTPVDQILDMARVVLAPEAEFSEGWVRKFKQKFGDLGDALKKAISKVVGFFDATAKIIYVDSALYAAKKTFLKLHETGHSFLPWQSKTYALIEECSKTLDPQVADEFDKEANVFATEVLFQCGSFSKEAADFKFEIKTPLTLSKKYGASIYASVREYVRGNHKSCTVLVLDMPEPAAGVGFTANLRRLEASIEFTKSFGQVQWPETFTPDDPIGAMVPLGKQRMSKPRHIVLVDSNGVEHECLAEAFTQKYQVFILIAPMTALTKKSIILSPF